jgi:predicted nucleic acid-binding protein
MSRGFLLDTNVPSELTRPQPDARAAQWLEDTDDDLMYLSVVTIGEVCKGITVHPEPHRRAGLRQRFENDYDRGLPATFCRSPKLSRRAGAFLKANAS